MTHPLPEFDKPPVIETVIGAQFEPIALTNALAGWYWKSVLESEWNSANQVPSINDVFEKFGAEREYRSTHQLRVSSHPTHDRLQISRNDNERLIQVQPSRFVYNWKKAADSLYPTYKILLPEFEQRFSEFVEFVVMNGLGDIKLNQWEITYVNHIRKGTLWQSVSDWTKLIPALEQLLSSPRADGFASLLQEEIGQQNGRLHTEIKLGKSKTSEDELLLLQFTARGPITDNVDLRVGCDLGHSEIVKAFDRMTSEYAHKHWKKRND